MSQARELRLDLRIPVRADRHQPVDPDFVSAALHAGLQELHDEGQPADLARRRVLGRIGLVLVRVADEDERPGRIGRQSGAPAFWPICPTRSVRQGGWRRRAAATCHAANAASDFDRGRQIPASRGNDSARSGMTAGGDSI